MGILIFDRTDVAAPIRQGDLFFGLPRVELSLDSMQVIGTDSQATSQSWKELIDAGVDEVACVVGVKRVDAIVISQDCDNVRSRDITLCEIRPFADVEGIARDTKASKSWVSVITQQARLNLKWFYLPPDADMGMTAKLAVDFQSTLRLPRVDLESLRSLRRGRLNGVADEHFRERLSEFFRRYPYDEWYPLNKDELDAYRQKYPDTQPFPWQQAV